MPTASIEVFFDSNLSELITYTVYVKEVNFDESFIYWNAFKITFVEDFCKLATLTLEIPPEFTGLYEYTAGNNGL